MSNVSRRRSRRRRLATALGVVLATGSSLSLAGTAAAASATGPEGQTITVSKVDGLDPAGETITVHGEGYAANPARLSSAPPTSSRPRSRIARPAGTSATPSAASSAIGTLT